MPRRERQYPELPPLDEPKQFRTARGTHDGVRSAVEPRSARSVPGSQERARSYAQSTLQPPRHRAYRHFDTRGRLSARVLTAIALMGVGVAADRVYESGQRPYDTAAELTHSAADVSQTLTENGSQGVVLVPLEGSDTNAEASQIATPAAVEEVGNILYAQQGNSNSITNTLAALPRGDLTSTELRSLPDGGKVTPLGLVALQNGGNDAGSIVPTPQGNIQ